MTREEFYNKIAELEVAGYKKNFNINEEPNPDGSHYLYKVIEYAEDKYGDNRAINQLLLKIFNFTPYTDRVPENSLFSLSPIIMFSRDTDERIDLEISHPKHDIEWLECKAKEFGDWCKMNMNDNV